MASIYTNLRTERQYRAAIGLSEKTFSIISVGALPSSVALADVNQDGNLDLLTANTNDASVSVRLGDGAGSFTGTTEISVGGSNPQGLAVADVNLDGRLDLLATNQFSATVSVRLGNGLGSFGAEQALAVGASPRDIATADINSDGKPDLLVTNSADNTVSVLLNTTPIMINPFGAATSVSAEASPQRVVASV